MAASGPEKAFCALLFDKNKCTTDVQRKFQSEYGKQPPTRKAMYKWHKLFVNMGCLCSGKSSGRPRVTIDNAEQVRETLTRSPNKSVQCALRELQMPATTVWKVLRKKLSMKPYKLQLVHMLKEDDKEKRFQICCELQGLTEEHDDFLNRLVFSDEATFHTNGKVNRHNCRIWGTQKPAEIIEHERDSPKVNVFCALSRRKLYGPFFFAEATVTGHSYLDMLQQWLMPQVQEDSDDFIYQQDGAPPHFHNDVRAYLNTELHKRWIGRAGERDECFLKWPPRSPELTPCDFFLWGYIKDRVYVPPLPRDVQELKQRIEEATTTVTQDMLDRVWQEFDYRMDICRVTRGSHIESL